jgi:ribose 5-phosphate isomerase A
LILDLSFSNGINQPELLESQINNIPGVLENGLFVNLTDQVLVGKVENDEVGVESLNKI